MELANTSPCVRPKYPKAIWTACFAAQLLEVVPSISLAEAARLAQTQFDDLCDREPEPAACEFAQRRRE